MRNLLNRLALMNPIMQLATGVAGLALVALAGIVAR